MSINPFHPDSAIAQRLDSRDGVRIRQIVRGMISTGCISARDVAALITAFSLPCVEDLVCQLSTEAETLVSPTISGFTVGAVGLCAGSGDLFLGGNIEFAGTNLHNTLHGEGVVAIRAFQRGETLSILGLGEAHPCGHCRQTLTEFSKEQDLLLIDPKGFRLSLSDLYPWPFDPAYLDQSGATARLCLELKPLGVPPVVELLLKETRIYAPFSKPPAALVLQTAARLVAGAVAKMSPSTPRFSRCRQPWWV